MTWCDFPHVEVTSGPTHCPARDGGRVSHSICHICFDNSDPSRPLAILLERVQKTLRQIAEGGSRGHRMVRLHTFKSLSPALTLIHDTDPLFFLHHAV
jgi:hypothetical protein